MISASKKRYMFRIVIPKFPAVNIYSYNARRTTALGPVCIASAVNKMDKWDAEVIDENNLRMHGPRDDSGGVANEFLEQLRPADVVGLYGGLTSTIPRLYEIARFYKERGVVTIAGGQHFSEDTIPEALSSGIDYIIIGEGEETIKELLRALSEKEDVNKVKGIAHMKDGEVVYTQERRPITDFDKLPLPNFSLVRYAKMVVYPIERIRGCGMNCEFCTVKGKPRCASPERMLASISFLVETRSAKKFFIVDDLFGQDRNETVRFCNMVRDYQRRIQKRLSFGVQIRLDKAKDTKLLSAMREAGIDMVAIGFESPVEEELKAMNKCLKPIDMVSFARVFHRFGFIVHGMFIFGYPLAKKAGFSMPATQRVKYLRGFIKNAKIDTIQVLLPVPLPGTELRDRLRKANRLYSKEELGWEYYDGNFPLFKPDYPLTPEEMQSAVWKTMNRFYQFKYMFFIGLNIFSFPSIVFFLHNIKMGWRRWYRPYHNSLIRFAGWILVKRWHAAFRQSNFLQKLKKAKEELRTA